MDRDRITQLTQRANTSGEICAAVAGSLLLLALLWLVHRGAFAAPFYFDTVAHLQRKGNLQLVELGWPALDAALRYDFGGRIYRPLAQLSLALTHWAFGPAPTAYRVGNLIIHWLAALSVFFLARTVLGLPRVRRTLPGPTAIPWVAGAATLLWALHPVHTNVVSYVIQRMASLCGLFTFLSVAAYLRARAGAGGWSWRWAGAALAAFLLALASKENAVTVLAVLPMCEWLLLDPPPVRVRRWLVGAAAGLAGVLLLAAWVYRGEIAGLLSYHHRPFTMGQRLLTQARLQIDYLGILLFPLPGSLVLTPDIPASAGLLDPPQTGLALLGLGAVLGLVWAAVRRAPLLSWCVLWYLATQLLEGTVLPLELYYEHRLYVPSVALALGTAFGVARIGAGGRRSAIGAAILVALLAGAEAAATSVRTRAWADPVVFWSEAVHRYPRSARNLSNLARALTQVKRFAEADAALQRAFSQPNAKQWIIELQRGRIAYQQGDYPAAREHLERSEALVKRSNWQAPQQLGLLALREGHADEAEIHLRRALGRNDRVAETWRLLGMVHLSGGHTGEAQEALGRAVGYGPGDAEVWNTLGAAYFQGERWADAEAAFTRALSLAPDRGQYRDNAGEARARRLQRAARGESP